MDGPEFIIIIVAIVCASGLIKTWINSNYDKNDVDEETFDRLAKAFMQHKKEMQERVQNLEAIITGEDEDEDFNQIEAPNNKSKLSNDLHQKDKVQS